MMISKGMLLDYDEFESPIGRILFASDSEGICALDYAGYESRMEGLLTRRFGDFTFRHGSDPCQLKRRLQRRRCLAGRHRISGAGLEGAPPDTPRPHANLW
jgi:hypothetical protein